MKAQSTLNLSGSGMPEYTSPASPPPATSSFFQIHRVLIAIWVLTIISLTGLLVWKLKYSHVTPPVAKACTEEAKICPDGSAVGRTGPNCEFAECPEQQVINNDTLEDWRMYTGETIYTTDGSSSFSIKYPASWLLEKNEDTSAAKLYPYGKSNDGDDIFIILGAGGHGLGNVKPVNKNYPAGTATYLWDPNYGLGLASFNLGNVSYIFEVVNLSEDKSSELEPMFEKMLTSFKLVEGNCPTGEVLKTCKQGPCCCPVNAVCD